MIQNGNRYDCSKCTDKDCFSKPRWQIEEGIYTTECPEHFVKPEIENFLIWKRFKQMGLPRAGGWLDQPAIAIDIIETLESEYDRWIESKKTDGN